MRDRAIDLCGAEGGGRAPDMPLLAAGDRFAFRCAGCGGCCRGREDLVLSGYDLYRLARRLGLPPRITARAFCRSYIGAVSRLPVLRLAPVRAEGNNCPFLTGGRCAVHEARPLACALYPLGQEITREGKVAYYFQNTGCGGREVRATLADYLAAQGIPEREPQDVLWAVRCMALEQEAPSWEAALGPVIFAPMSAVDHIDPICQRQRLWHGQHLHAHDQGSRKQQKRQDPSFVSHHAHHYHHMKKGSDPCLDHFLTETGKAALPCSSNAADSRSVCARTDLPDLSSSPAGAGCALRSFLS